MSQPSPSRSSSNQPAAQRGTTSSSGTSAAGASAPPPPARKQEFTDKRGRLVSLDAYRGFIMLVLAASGFGLVQMGRKFDQTFWGTIGAQFEHTAWVGCNFWDLIQPAFMFMVGMAAPYSYARRADRGKTFFQSFRHALARSIMLILLGVFLSSRKGPQTDFLFTNVLAQIGLGYMVVFLLTGRGWIVQSLAIVAVLGGTWYLFYQFTPIQPDLVLQQAIEKYSADTAKLLRGGSYVPLTGLFEHWNIYVNYAAHADQWLLNQFPRTTPYVFTNGGYQTLNFLPSIATMLMGLMAGEYLQREEVTPPTKAKVLLLAGLACLLLGLVLGFTVCPIVKRIWTPSWALASGAAVIWMLAAFYWLIDVRGYHRWAWPLVVVGMNSLVMYMLGALLPAWVWSQVQIHFGWLVELVRTSLGWPEFDDAYLPLVQNCSVALVFWMICWWMYRQKLFVKL